MRQAPVEYDISLGTQGDAIRVRFVRESKNVVDFVVQFEAFIEYQYRPVVRYDGSHGRPHRDILDWNGETIAKQWASAQQSNSQALTDAIEDIGSNWQLYLVEFMKRRS